VAVGAGVDDPQATSPAEGPTVVAEDFGEGITVVRLNRPERLNAMMDRLFVDAVAVLDAIAADDSCRVVILTGAGRAFSAGGDLGALDVIDGQRSSVPRMRRTFELSARMITGVQSLPQPVIAAVNGPATGGGLSLALAADTRICDESARFSAAFVKLGLSGCEMGTSYLLPRIVGPTAAFEIMMSGRLIDSAEALRLGLVLEVVPDAGLMDRAIALARSFAANSPIGLALTKEITWRSIGAGSLAEALAAETHAQMLCGHTADHREAVAGFLEKRRPSFGNT
jgi:enoyl-CoA hydratase